MTGGKGGREGEERGGEWGGRGGSGGRGTRGWDKAQFTGQCRGESRSVGVKGVATTTTAAAAAAATPTGQSAARGASELGWDAGCGSKDGRECGTGRGGHGHAGQASSKIPRADFYYGLD